MTASTKKTRLNKNHRRTLQNFIRGKLRGELRANATMPDAVFIGATSQGGYVRLPKPLLAAHKKVSAAIKRDILKQRPAKDMAVCKKYSVAKIDDCLKLQLNNGQVAVFHFRKGEGPLLPTSDRSTYNSKIWQLDPKTNDAAQEFLEAAGVIVEAAESKLRDYYALIEASQTFEELLIVWPEVEEVRSQICGYALPATVTEEMAARIKADSEARMKVEAAEAAKDAKAASASTAVVVE